MKRGMILIMVLCGVTSRAAAAQESLRDEVIRALDAQNGTATGLVTKYTLTMARSSKNKDPGDREAWAADPFQIRPIPFQVSLLGKDARITFFGNEYDNPYEQSWVDGRRTMVTTAEDGTLHASIDDNRYRVSWAFPVLTPLLMELFDVRLSLADFARLETTTISRAPDGSVTLTGDVRLDGSPEIDRNSENSWHWPWRIVAKLNPDRDYLPDLVTAEFKGLRGSTRGKSILWNLRTDEAGRDASGWYISKALIWMKNDALPPGERERWQIYAYEVEQRDVRRLSKASLVVPIPTRNGSVTNELDGTYREFDASGAVIDRRDWTKEERAAELAAILEANNARLRLQLDSAAARKFYFTSVVIGAAAITLALLAWRMGWLTRSRSQPM